MTRYHYIATRKSDETEIHAGTITDVGNEGMGAVAAYIRAALIKGNTNAAGLKPDDIDVTIWVAA